MDVSPMRFSLSKPLQGCHAQLLLGVRNSTNPQKFHTNPWKSPTNFDISRFPEFGRWARIMAKQTVQPIAIKLRDVANAQSKKQALLG
eukprot:scaffold8408_cov169-Ochromonas_danica.AAC.1